MAEAAPGGEARQAQRGTGTLARILDSDLLYSFRRSKLVVVAAIVTVMMVGAALLAPLIVLATAATIINSIHAARAAKEAEP